jgi:hypothetical protein
MSKCVVDVALASANVNRDTDVLSSFLKGPMIVRVMVRTSMLFA